MRLDKLTTTTLLIGGLFVVLLWLVALNEMTPTTCLAYPGLTGYPGPEMSTATPTLVAPAQGTP